MAKFLFLRKKKSFLVISGCFFIFYSHAQNSFLSDLQEDRTKGFVRVNKFVSNSANITSVALPLSILAVGLIKNDKNEIQKGSYIAESVALSTIVSITLKNTFKRPRPYVKDPTIIPLSREGSYSFPSGHTSEAFAIATSLSISYPKWYVIVPSYLWAGSVAYSRMYLGVHYTSDVVAGAIVGAGSAFLTRKVNNWFQKKHQAHVNQKVFN
ncbi:MAG TPA: phosphatase PAP2 family protein [Chitinophagaceae bacterium]|nr:phosphatase PAP2 family protein [Chitinophagaceae bacterium]